MKVKKGLKKIGDESEEDEEKEEEKVEKKTRKNSVHRLLLVSIKCHRNI